MKELILFRKELDSLNDEEFQTCINLFGREDITTILFHGFHQRFKHNKMHKINKINNIITEIQISRKEKKNDDVNQQDQDNHNDEDIDIESNTQNTKIKADQLPSIIISEISAYLTFTESISFERSNRSIFIGSCSPSISISQPLDGNEFTKLLTFYNQNNNNIQYPQRLRKFKSLTINADDMTYYDEEKREYILKYKWNHLEIFNHIKEFQIKFVETPDDGELAVMSEHMKSGKFSDLSNVKTIRIVSDDDDAVYSAEAMATLLSFIKNASKLNLFELSMHFVDANSIFSAPYEWISKLRGIAINNLYQDGDENNSLKDIYSAIGNNLESFHKTSSLFIDTINGKLNGLKELCLPWHSDESDINILNQQNLSNIKRIFFNNAAGSQTAYNKHTIEVLMNKIIGSAEYIGINMAPNPAIRNSKSFDVFDILTNSLECMEKEALKFRINEMSLEKTDIFNINDIVNILSSNCSNFMFIANNLKFPKNSKSLDNLLEIIKAKHTVIYSKNPINGKDDAFLGYNFVISNKDCNISGYYEPWIMKCAYCQQHVVFDWR